jgi:hypothetical protein
VLAVFLDVRERLKKLGERGGLLDALRLADASWPEPSAVVTEYAGGGSENGFELARLPVRAAVSPVLASLSLPAFLLAFWPLLVLTALFMDFMVPERENEGRLSLPPSLGPDGSSFGLNILRVG